MRNPRLVRKLLTEISSVPTAHQTGQKTVLLNNQETSSNITQIALTELHQGETVEEHVHPTMDEHYLFLSGKGVMIVDGEEMECKEGIFLLIPATSKHGMSALTNMKFLTIGVAL